MLKQMMQTCCGADGKPDVDKMTTFMEQQDRASVFDIVGWALFLIWVGVAWLLNIGLGYGLLGVGVLTLAMQTVRHFNSVKVEGFWVFVGFAFMVGALWEIWSVDIPLAPIVLIALGIGILLSRYFRKDTTTVD